MNMPIFKLPIKEINMRLGLLVCDVCGSALCNVRGRYPDEKSRIICPTCAIETLESILESFQSPSQVADTDPNKNL